MIKSRDRDCLNESFHGGEYVGVVIESALHTIERTADVKTSSQRFDSRQDARFRSFHF
jgi:hypothetical protein